MSRHVYDVVILRPRSGPDNAPDPKVGEKAAQADLPLLIVILKLGKWIRQF